MAILQQHTFQRWSCDSPTLRLLSIFPHDLLVPVILAYLCLCSRENSEWVMALPMIKTSSIPHWECGCGFSILDPSKRAASSVFQRLLSGSKTSHLKASGFLISELGPDCQSLRESTGAVERCPQGRKQAFYSTSTNVYKRRKQETSSLQAAGRRGDRFYVTERVRKRTRESQAKGIPPPPLPVSPADGASANAPGQGPSNDQGRRVCAGRAGSADEETQVGAGKAPGGSRSPAILPPWPHSPAHGPETGPAAGVLGCNWVLRDHFRIQPVSRK